MAVRRAAVVVVVVVVVSLQVDVLLSTCSSTMALTRSALFICIVGDASMISSIFSWYERLLTENVLSGCFYLCDEEERRLPLRCHHLGVLFRAAQTTRIPFERVE